jgi:hypothetical protein
MFNWRMRNEDTPQDWFRGIRINYSNLTLKIIEVVVIGGIVMAFILPAFS